MAIEGASTIHTREDTCLEVRDGQVMHSRDPSRPILGYRPSSAPDVIFFAAADGSPLDIEGEAGASRLLSYRLLPAGDGFVLRHPSTGKHLGSWPAPAGATAGRVVCTDDGGPEPEPFYLREPSSEDARAAFSTLAMLDGAGQGVLDPDHVAELARANNEAADSVLIALLRLCPPPGIPPLVRRIRDTPAYARIFPLLRMHVSGHRPVWGAYTRLTLAEQIKRYGWEIGEHTYGTPDVLDPGYGHLRIGRYCSISAGVVICLANHLTEAATTYPFSALMSLWPGADPSLPDHTPGSVDIGSDVWIGHGARILPGTLVGDGCIIGAGASVKGYVPPYSVIAGNPGRVVRPRLPPATADRLLRARWWDLPDAVVDGLVPQLLSGQTDTMLDNVEAARRSLPAADRAALKGGLQPCTGLWGECRIIEADPKTHRARDVIYLPFRNGRPWGIFDPDGRIVPGTVDYHGPNRVTPLQVLATEPDSLADIETAPDEAYIYGGFINPHYGHFLINTLSRFWHLARERPRAKILCHAGAAAANWLALPFAGRIFEQLGLRQEAIAQFDRPVRIRELIVPEPAFEEQRHAHRVFRDLCLSIGDGLVEQSGIKRLDAPAYVSKHRMHSGVGRAINERELVKTLEAAGFDIVHPELLDFERQLKLFASRRLIVGTTGSAFHTSIFLRELPTVISINPIPDVNANFPMMDQLAGLTAEYHFPSDTEVVREPGDTFLTSFAFANPQRVASEIIRLARDGMTAPCVGASSPGQPE